ncbi:MAG: formyltetrahydrofolate deformylase, partial [Tannerella sp.]|nr:formyltetrahydrofolate deformylase [Tannerella sp.]
MNTAKLLLHCPDRAGIVTDITNFISINNGNIIYLDQHVDHVENIFFMRLEWDLENFLIPNEKIEDYFDTLYARKYDITFRLYFSDYCPRMAIFVSKLSHCLYDILARYTAGEWKVEIPLIISNHDEMREVAGRFGVPFHVFPITKDNKAEQEERELQLLRENRVDFIVLARYMQVLSERMIHKYPNKIINIHHSF